MGHSENRGRLVLEDARGEVCVGEGPKQSKCLPCFVVCVAVLAHFRRHVRISGPAPMEHPLYGTAGCPPAHGLFFYSRSSDCMPSRSRHSPVKRKRKMARLPRKMWSPDPLTRPLLYFAASLCKTELQYMYSCAHSTAIIHEIPDKRYPGRQGTPLCITANTAIALRTHLRGSLLPLQCSRCSGRHSL
jgi:hypothetical protein